MGGVGGIPNGRLAGWPGALKGVGISRVALYEESRE